MQQGMCLMDVTTNLPPKWKMYNIPTERVVSYSILLKQNREFQQFISQLKSEVSNKVSCCILDNTSVTSCEEELNIYIFDKSVGFNNLHLKILLSKQNIRKKITLLIHLASKNNAMSRLQNLCMYIKCKEHHLWETFYNMFGFLLKKSSLNLIGTQFYVSLFCQRMVASELKLLHSLSSQLLITESKQNYVQISFETSIGVQENINNFVKTRQPTMQKTDIQSGEAKVLPVPDQMLKLNSVTVKRKFNDIENNKRVKTLKVSHEIRKRLCDCHEKNNWKVYKLITRQPVVNYIDLLKSDFDFGDMEYSETHSIPSEDFQIPESVHVHENIKKHLSSSEKHFSNLESTENFDPPMNSCQFTKANLDVELFQTENVHNRNENKSDEKCASQINSNTTSNKPILDTTKNVSCKNNNYDALEDEKYSIDIKETDLSSKSLKNPLVVDEFKNIRNTQTRMPLPNTTQVPVMGFQSCNKNVSIDKLSKGFQSISSCKASVPPKTFQSISISNFPEAVGFQTAAGKSLNISEKAILAAQKMFDEVCSQEINLFDKDEAASCSKAKKPVYPVANNIDNEFNSVFADKFFEEFPFDDKEGEFEPKVDLQQPLPLKFDNKVSQVGKVRKSLGGRRSLKPYSVKK